jgi:tetratricopeptide (TPR) repeat protein
LESLLRTARNVLRRKGPQARPAPATPLSARELLESAFKLHQSGRLAEALPLYRSAIDADPSSDVAHNLLGGLLCGEGRLAEGEVCFQRALEINPSNFEALSNVANIRKDQGDLSRAESLYRRALELRPDFAAGWNNLGLLYMASSRLDAAADCFRLALRADERNADAHNNLGSVSRIQGAMSEAEGEFRAAIDVDPGLAEAWCGLGDVLRLRRLLDEAEGCCRKALELRSNYPDAINNLATIATARGHLDSAKAFCDEALRIQPNHVGALNNLGSLAVKRADYDAAEAVYRKALRFDPNCAVTRFNLSTTLLMLGNYGEGFDLYESRFESFTRPFTRSSVLNEKLRARPRWRGEALGATRLLVWAEQGLGDCIMMLRYLPELRTRGVERVVVYCEPALRRVVESMAAAERVVTTDEGAGTFDFDVHCPMMSLPWAFGTRLDTIPRRHPYISVPESMVAMWRERLGGRAPKVGLAWAGSGRLEDDARRSIPLEQFAQLLSLDGVRFVSLQKGDAAKEWRRMERVEPQCIDDCADFLDTAALLMNLDLVISVDTAVAHLAGALARPVWLLNRFGSEWRWGLRAETSCWYQTMRIYREPALERWEAVVDLVENQLTASFER